MHLVSKMLVGLVAAIQSYILVLEMFLWESRGPKVFTNFSADFFEPTKVFAANQGLYNGFLAAGLIWALVFIKDVKWKQNVALFFLSCVAIAGVYGTLTVTRSIFFAQALPAILGIASLLFLRGVKQK